ncbi:MAG: glycine cleavage system protein GcvH [Bdellovibrionota bacterium]
MSEIPASYKFTKEHEWLKQEANNRVRVGITDYAQSELGDVVFIELPEIGKTVKQGDSLSSVESVKAVSDVYAPVDGRVVEVNTALSGEPQLINQEPHEGGWIAILEVANSGQISGLLSSEAYSGHLAEISK